LISSVLIVSFAQRLVRTICPYCKENYNPPANTLATFGITTAEAKNANFQRGKGLASARTLDIREERVFLKF